MATHEIPAQATPNPDNYQGKPTVEAVINAESLGEIMVTVNSRTVVESSGEFFTLKHGVRSMVDYMRTQEREFWHGAVQPGESLVVLTPPLEMQASQPELVIAPRSNGDMVNFFVATKNDGTKVVIGSERISSKEQKGDKGMGLPQGTTVTTIIESTAPGIFKNDDPARTDPSRQLAAIEAHDYFKAVIEFAKDHAAIL